MKVISTFAQINSLIAITALLSYYLNDQSIGVNIAISFGCMRLLQVVC